MKVPTIEANGEINEVILPGDIGPRLVLVVAGNPPFLSFRTPTDPRIEHRIYTRETFSVGVDRHRFVAVDIYVSERFMDHIQKDLRPHVISRFVSDRAAWFFSYGTRQIKEK